SSCSAKLPPPVEPTRASWSVSWAAAPCTVTVNEPVAVLPEASVAVHSTVVEPIGNMLPEGGAQETVGFRSQLSVAAADKLTEAPPGPVASTPVMSPGTVSSGGVVSSATLLAAAALMYACTSSATRTRWAARLFAACATAFTYAWWLG